ncbi:MAG: OadG family protein [Treponema sp.]|jgi:oxaloacetate decarboxylase gamma subunit|nr:OadG family protein [Treponema sp.]
MTIIEMLGQSGVLTLLGMSVVFSFLIILIFSITGVGKIIIAMKLNKELMGAGHAASIVSGNGASITAAISAAVSEYRKSKK